MSFSTNSALCVAFVSAGFNSAAPLKSSSARCHRFKVLPKVSIAAFTAFLRRAQFTPRTATLDIRHDHLVELIVRERRLAGTGALSPPAANAALPCARNFSVRPALSSKISSPSAIPRVAEVEFRHPVARAHPARPRRTETSVPLRQISCPRAASFRRCKNRGP